MYTQPSNLLFHNLKEVVSSEIAQGVVIVQYGVTLLCGGNVGSLFSCFCKAADIFCISGELTLSFFQLGDGYQFKAFLVGRFSAEVKHWPIWV